MFKKRTVVGVSVSPEMGLEVAEVDYASGTVLKYKRKSVEYNAVKREIADLDLFKESLQDLLEELNIQKGAELVLNLPTVSFKVADFPASLETTQIEAAIEEELYENPYLKNYEPCYSYAIVNSSLQFNKYAYTALQKSTIIELVMSIKEMGYKISTIDTSVNSLFHSLVYLNRVNTDPDTNWLLLIVDNTSCRILSMMGRNYVDAYEEKISIGDVLGDAENYASVITAIEPVLKSLPSKYLCVVSKTNVISAEVLSNKISYSAPIIYQESNGYLKEPFLKLSPLVDEEYTKSISLDVIGAAIYHEYKKTSLINFNMFNKTLGEVFLLEQPPSIMNGKIVLTNSFLIMAGIIIAAIVALLVILICGTLAVQNAQMNSNIEQMETEINRINRFLEKNKDISSDAFDEGTEIKLGLNHNKNIYSYYTIVGTEIPQKLWLTYLKLSDKTTIEGQADNIESVYSFFRSIKDYNPTSDISLQDLGLATVGPRNFDDSIPDAETLLTSLDADFYKFKISNEVIKANTEEDEETDNKKAKNKKAKKSASKNKKAKKSAPKEAIKE